MQVQEEKETDNHLLHSTKCNREKVLVVDSPVGNNRIKPNQWAISKRQSTREKHQKLQ